MRSEMRSYSPRRRRAFPVRRTIHRLRSRASAMRVISPQPSMRASMLVSVFFARPVFCTSVEMGTSSVCQST